MLGAKITVPSLKFTAPGRADANAGDLLDRQVRLVDGVLRATGDALDDFVHPPLRLGAELGGGDALEG